MERIDRGNTVARGQRWDLHAMVGQENIRHRDQTAVWVARQRAKDGFPRGLLKLATKPFSTESTLSNE
jgi:hypothetical protein